MYIVPEAPILSIEEIKSFLDEKSDLLSTPNVVSLGFSNERVDGKKTGGKIFRVGVIKKLPRERIEYPDFVIPKFFKHIFSSDNRKVVIPVTIEEEGELEFIGHEAETKKIGPGEDDPPYKGGILIQNASNVRTGCLGVNAEYKGKNRLLTVAHLLTRFDPKNIGKNVLVREKGKEKFNVILATVTGQVDVTLYDTFKKVKQPNVVSACQDLAWADFTEGIGSPEIKNIGIPGKIRKINPDERVKYYAGFSNVVGRNVEVEDIEVRTKIKIENKNGAEKPKYASFTSLCLFKPPKHLEHGDSGTAIVAESDNALVGMLMSRSPSKTSHYFCKLQP